jgi:hypothetical protein
MEFFLDIVLHERLHCASYTQLNDPFEGMFFSSNNYSIPPPPHFSFPLTPLPNGSKIQTVNSIKDLPLYVEKLRVCSLSATLSDVRLWSYYADSHQGVAIEIDFSSNKDDANEVKYVTELQEHGLSLLGSPPPDKVLSFKTTHWLHENEYRIIQESDFYPIKGRISAIYTGINLSQTHLDLLTKLVPSTIHVIKTKLNPLNLVIEPDLDGKNYLSKPFFKF